MLSHRKRTLSLHVFGEEREDEMKQEGVKEERRQRVILRDEAGAASGVKERQNFDSLSRGEEKIRGGRPLGEMCQPSGNEGALILKTNVIAGVCLTCGSLDGFITSSRAKDQGETVRNKVSQLDLQDLEAFMNVPHSLSQILILDVWRYFQ